MFTHSQISGRILYDKNGISYAAPMSELRADIGKSSNPIFSSSSSYDEILGKFSYPSNSSKQRGYVIFTINHDFSKPYSIKTLMSYYHQTNPLVIPYTDICDGFSNGKYDFTDNFEQSSSNWDKILEPKYFEKTD